MLKKSLNRKINLLSKFFVFKTNVTADENMVGKKNVKKLKKNKKIVKKISGGQFFLSSTRRVFW